MREMIRGLPLARQDSPRLARANAMLLMIIIISGVIKQRASALWRPQRA